MAAGGGKRQKRGAAEHVGDAKSADSPDRLKQSETEYTAEQRGGTVKTTAQEDEEGIRKMLYAILERTVRDATESTSTVQERKEKRRTAFAFLNYQGFEPFSFRWICEHLSVDPQSTRKQILQFVRSANSLDLQPNCTGDLAVSRYIRTYSDPNDPWDILTDVRHLEGD